MLNHGPLCEFDALGVLKVTQVPQGLRWMSQGQIELLLALRSYGEGGMTRSRAKKLDRTAEDDTRILELRDYLKWERDRFGRLRTLTLTWKGDEAAEILHRVAINQSDAAATEAARAGRERKVK